MNQGNPNLAARLARVAARHPERPAIVEAARGRRRSVTFGELSKRVAALAAGFETLGLHPGQSALLFVPMSIDLYVALLAVLHLGAIAGFVDAWAGASRLAAGVRAIDPRLFVGTPAAHLLRLVSKSVRDLPIHIIAGRGALRLARFERRERLRPPALVTPDLNALVTFTTGSTGRPKAAARSHGFLWAQHEALNHHLGIVPDDVDMPTLPVFVLNNLAVGATTILPPIDPRHPGQFDPEVVVRLMEEEKVTTASGSPIFFDKLCRWCAEHGRRLPLRAAFTGGAPVPPMQARLLADTIAGSAHIVYGSTEAEPIAGIEARAMLAAMARDWDQGSQGGQGYRQPPDGVCVGEPVPEIAIRLVAPTDDPIVLGEGGWESLEVPEGDPGEIVVCGPHVLGRYFNDPESDRRTKIQDGGRVWHRTGDVGRFDDEGRLWLMGRVSWRIVRSGQTWWNIPAEIRALKLAGVRHAAYFGRPDSGYGHRAVLCVENLGGELMPIEKERLRIALAPMPVDEIHAFQRIPRDPRHESKTNLVELRRKLDERTPEDVL